MRRKATGTVDAGFPKAETLAYRPGMYRLAAPPAGVDRDVVDKLWDPVENGLRDLVARLAARHLQPGDDTLLFDYAATARVRHPSFEDVVTDYQARHGQSAPQGDGVQYARVLALGNQRPVMPTWRWRVLHSPADAPRFMITDYLNAAAWDDPFIVLLVAHPDDQSRLAALPDHRNLRIKALGPYRNRESIGLFD